MRLVSLLQNYMQLPVKTSLNVVLGYLLYQTSDQDREEKQFCFVCNKSTSDLYLATIHKL